MDPGTEEWQILAAEVTNALTDLYGNSAKLGQSFNRVEVEAFSPGSVVVDYYLVFDHLEEGLTTRDLKEVTKEMVERDGKLGRFQIDTHFSDFIVVGTNEEAEPSTGPDEEEMLLPKWAIAVVVIGLGSLAFVIIFGASMLAKRRRVSRGKKQGMSLTEEMVYELNRSGSHGYGLDGYSYAGGLGPDGLVNMESWKTGEKLKHMRDQERFKRGSSQTSSGVGSSTPGPYQSNMYDSWKTEWNPHYRDYQTTHLPQPTSSYMTKGGRRPAYEDDF